MAIAIPVPGWTEQQYQRFEDDLLTGPRGELTERAWGQLCDTIRTLASHLARTALRRHVELARTVLIGRPELGLTTPPDLERLFWSVRISPRAYLRAMWNLFWSAVRHPLSDTTIDLSTGRVLYRT
jgi:hypothetical protein